MVGFRKDNPHVLGKKNPSIFFPPHMRLSTLWRKKYVVNLTNFLKESISQKWGIWNLNKKLIIRKKEQKW